MQPIDAPGEHHSQEHEEIVVYWRPGCPFCSSLRGGLHRAGLPFREVDIWSDRDAAAFVRSVARGNETVPTVSIGIATSDVSGTRDAEHLLSTAGTAMREAKTLGPDRTLFVDAALEGAASRRLAVEGLLRLAIPRGELQPWFQPVVAIGTGEVIGYEALVRWFRPDGTVVQPYEFLPVAERSALIVDLDRSVLSQSIAALAGLPDRQHIAVTDPLGPQLADGTLVATLAALEPGHRYDWARCVTLADPRPNGTVALRGTKVHVANGADAHLLCVLARHECRRVGACGHRRRTPPRLRAGDRARPAAP